MKGFKSVAWVAAVGSAALGCYMVSLEVATERSDLARVEAQIVTAKQDIRALQTELGTRGRLSQLEHWNAEVLALSAPSSAQFVDSAFTLARLEQREPTLGEQVADVRLASAEAVPQPSAPAAKPAAPVVQAVAPPAAAPQPTLVHRAGLVTAPAVPAPQPKKPEALAAKAPAKKPEPVAAKAPVKKTKGIDSTLAAEIGDLAREAEGTGGN